MAFSSPTVKYALGFTPELDKMLRETIPDGRRAFVIENLLWEHPFFMAYRRKEGIAEPPRRRKRGRPVYRRTATRRKIVPVAEGEIVTKPDDTTRVIREYVVEPAESEPKTPPSNHRGRPSKNQTPPENPSLQDDDWI
jgi:hypothetical protein